MPFIPDKIKSMNNILFVNNNCNQDEFLLKLLNKNGFDVSFCSNPDELTEFVKNSNIDIILIADTKKDFIYECQKNKSSLEKIFVPVVILLNKDANELNDSKMFQAYLPYNDVNDCNIILNNIFSLLKLRKHICTLEKNNTDLQKSLYQLDSLYNTSSQLAGTLDKNKLMNILIGGLEKSLSYNLSYSFVLDDDNNANLIINSLQQITPRLEKALKLRALLTYKSLLSSKKYQTDLSIENIQVTKYMKHNLPEYDLNIFKFDNLFAPIDIGNKFFGFIEVFKENDFAPEDATCFQTLAKQVSVPLESAILYEEISKTNKKLERLERLKSEFISIVSHELRTPLTAIKNSLDILLSGATGELSGNANKFIGTAKRNVERLTAIINDLLDLSKIEAGKMQLHFEKINILPTVEFIQNTFLAQAKEKQIELTSNISQNNEPVYVFADRIKIEQILSNLVSNAIKFTNSGGNIVIDTKIVKANKITYQCFPNSNNCAENYVLISVKDTGIGIKEEDVHKVFDEFQQIENSKTRTSGGTGLGLPIAKQLTEKHFGMIWLESEIDKGTVFYIALPVFSEKTSFYLKCESILQNAQIHKKAVAFIRIKEPKNEEYSLIDKLNNNISIVTTAVDINCLIEDEKNNRIFTMIIPEADKYAAEFVIQKLQTDLLQNSTELKYCDILYTINIFPDDEPDSRKIMTILSSDYKKLKQG